MTFTEDLVSHLGKLPAAPFLFVGSGFSRRYVGADDWAGLLSRFAAPTGKSFERYSSGANGDLPQIASLIAKDFHDIWWDEDQYSASRVQFPHPKGQSSPLKIEIASYLSGAVDALPTSGELFDELVSLRKATIEGVITTNYDGVLESLFPDFAVFAGQDELLFHDPKGVGEIYKIHGSHSDPESMVLDSEDYKRFSERNVYLAAKLLTIFVEHPIIFIGYSLTDEDVQEILTSIAHVLTSENLSKLQDRLIFIQWDRSATTSSLVSTPFAADGMAIPMLAASVPDYSELFSALGQLKRRFPTKFLRQLKEQVYELVQTSTPTEKLYVMDIDADVDTADVDVVIGVGIKNRIAQQGVVGIERKDLQRDLLNPYLPYDDPETMSRIVQDTLPRYLQGRANTPIYRYLRGAGFLTAEGELTEGTQLPEAVQKRFEDGLAPLRAPSGYIRRVLEKVKKADSFGELVEQNLQDDVLFAAPHMPLEKIVSEELRQFLIDTKESATSGNSLKAAQWGKCLCFYDYVKYKRG